MRRHSPIAYWFFPIEKAPVLGDVTRNGEARNVMAPQNKELAASDTWHNVSVVAAVCSFRKSYS